MPEKTTRVSALRTGKIDMIGSIGRRIFTVNDVDTPDSLRRTNPGIVSLPDCTVGSQNIIFVTSATKPPFDDIRVRQAMQKAIDVKTISLSYYNGVASWLSLAGATTCQTGYHTPFEEWPEELKQEYSYDPDAAEALLDAAGHERGADGIRFKTQLKVNAFYVI